MKQLFLDTNVMIDFLSDRKPFSSHAKELFNASARGIAQLFVSAISFNNSYFILAPINGHQKTLRELENFEELVTVVDLSREILKAAMRSPFSDFEDAIQHCSALSIPKISAIVTRDKNDFRRSEIAVVSPSEAVALVLDEQ